MPSTTLNFDPADTVSDWTDGSAAAEADECEIAKGTFHGVPVTYYVDTQAGLVRAAPADLAAAGEKLCGVRYFRYRLYTLLRPLLGLDERGTAMKGLWRFSARDSDEFCARGITGLRARRLKAVAVRPRQRAPENVAGEPKADSPAIEAAQGEAAPAQRPHADAPCSDAAPLSPASGTPAIPDKSCAAGGLVAPSAVAIRRTPVNRQTRPRTGATFHLCFDAIGVYCVRFILSLLTPADRNAMALVSRGIYAAASENRGWVALRNRASIASSPKRAIKVLTRLGFNPASCSPASLAGERLREADVLHALVRRTMPAQPPSAAYETVAKPLLHAIMALRVPARYRPLLAWLEEVAQSRCVRIALHPDAPAIYAELPGQQKAALCIALCKASQLHARWLGLQDQQWLDIARSTSPATVPGLARAVIEYRTYGDGAYATWSQVSSAVRDVLNDAMALDDARRAGVIEGLITYADCMLRQRSRRDSVDGPPAGLAAGSLWHAMIDAIPVSHAVGPLLRLAAHFHHGRHRLVAAEQLNALMDRLTSTARDTLSLVLPGPFDTRRSAVGMRRLLDASARGTARLDPVRLHPALHPFVPVAISAPASQSGGQGIEDLSRGARFAGAAGSRHRRHDRSSRGVGRQPAHHPVQPDGVDPRREGVDTHARADR